MRWACHLQAEVGTGGLATTTRGKNEASVGTTLRVADGLDEKMISDGPAELGAMNVCWGDERVLFVCNKEWGLARPQTGKSTAKVKTNFEGVSYESYGGLDYMRGSATADPRMMLFKSNMLDEAPKDTNWGWILRCDGSIALKNNIEMVSLLK